MSYSFQNPSAEVIESYLKICLKTIAIVGLCLIVRRQHLIRLLISYKLLVIIIIPVNPKLEGPGELLGEHVYAYLKDIPFSI